MKARAILIAESQQQICTQLQRTLRHRGWVLTLVQDRAEAIRLIAELHAEIDVAMLVMLSADDLGTVREIRHSFPTLPLLVLSDDSSPRAIAEVTRSGATGFLALPAKDENLIDRVEEVVRGREWRFPGGDWRLGKDVFLFRNPRMQAIQQAMRQIALSDAPVVILGESGVGKEILARQLHHESPRSAKPFLKLNCAAVPSELLESELFGYEPGAFTGALKRTPGKFELADGGTILLDEIGDMDFKLQAKLLHVLQDKEFQHLGGRATIRVDVRVISATHSDLENSIEQGRFRQDLYYRLNVIEIHIPPLREREDEILPLAHLFLERYAHPGTRIPEISPRLEQALLAHNWPGNIRELENTMRKLLVFNDPDMTARELESLFGHRQLHLFKQHAAGSVSPADGHTTAPGTSIVDRASHDAEAQVILEALGAAHWNRKRAAKMLEIDYKALLYRMKKLRLDSVESAHPVMKRR